jgi:hypothetical protein
LCPLYRKAHSLTPWIIRLVARIQLEYFHQRIGANTMAISREQARNEHTGSTAHDQFSETIYGVVCSTCHNYILIDKTNCPPSCREHETCRAAYA